MEGLVLSAIATACKRFHKQARVGMAVWRGKVAVQAHDMAMSCGPTSGIPASAKHLCPNHPAAVDRPQKGALIKCSSQTGQSTPFAGGCLWRGVTCWPVAPLATCNENSGAQLSQGNGHTSLRRSVGLSTRTLSSQGNSLGFGMCMSTVDSRWNGCMQLWGA